MDYIVQLISTFIDSVAMIMALVLMVSILQRKDRNGLKNTLIMGSLFSFTLVLSMADPIDLGAGGIHDLRGLLIGTGVALLGPVVGLMTLVSGLAMRFFLGGPGMIAGFAAMFGAFAGGLIWRKFIGRKPLSAWQKSFSLGVFISLHLVALFLLPRDLWGALWSQMAPYYLIANLIGASMISFLVGGELSFLSEAESAKIDANTDHLTGLLNRRGLNVIAPELKARFTPNKGRALLYFDVDNFKEANDTYGHAVGDEVLKRVVDRVAESLRRVDIFVRMGGDEFAIVLPEVDVKEAQAIAERCRLVVAEEEFIHDKVTLPITISLGAIWLHKPTELDRMLQAADEALYQAKSSGRNAVVFLSNIGLVAKKAVSPPLAEAS